MRKPEAIIGEDRLTQLFFEGYAVVPADPTPEAVGAWWRCTEDYEPVEDSFTRAAAQLAAEALST